MEINARVYAVSRDEELLEQVHDVLEEKAFWGRVSVETLEPCAVLPLSQVWYGFTERAEPTDDPEEWMDCLEECAGILGKNGAVVVEFRSPDHPDDYLEYAWTNAGGSAGAGGRLWLAGYDRALGNRDISLAIGELISGRSERERAAICRRREKKEAVRREKGNFEITPDGVLERYRGHDVHVVIPEGVKAIGEAAFVDMKGVERMLLEDEEYDAPEMETLTIPEGVESIRYYAFAYCMNLKEVRIADSVVSIGGRAFEGCESLKKVELPNGLGEIGEYTFFLCEELKAIRIPDSVRHIRKGAFYGSSLGRVSFPEGLESIEKEAFTGCCFKKVRVPAGTEVEDGAFPKGTEVIR